MFKLKDNILTEFADVKLAVLLFSVGLLVLVLSLLLVHSMLLTQAAITVMLASMIYLLMRWARRKDQGEESPDEEAPATSPSSLYMNQILDIAFWGLLIAAMFMLTQGVYARPLGFLIMVSAMAAILAVQIFSGRSTGYCIIKILVIAILLRASAYYQFPSLAGYDAIAEADSLAQLLANGHIGEFMKGYEYYPTAHYFAASVSLTTGLGVMDSFFMLGIAEALSLVFVFLIGRHFFNARIGLLAALIMAVFDWHIIWGFYVKAMTLSIALLPMVIFLIMASLKNRRLTFVILGMLIMALIILTHTFTTAVLAVILFIGWVMFMLLRQVSSDEAIRPPVSLTIALLFGCATLAYWMYVSGFTQYIANTISYAFTIDADSVPVVALTMNTAEDVWQKLPTMLFMFLATLGCLSIFNIRRLEGKTLLQVWLALLCGTLVIVNFVIFFAPQFGPLIRERWFVFVGLIVAIPVAYGLVNIASRRSWQSLTGLFITMFLFAAIMTTSSISNSASVISWGSESYLAATQSELAAADTINEIADFTDNESPAGDKKIYTDHYYSQVFTYNEDLRLGEVADFSELYKYELQDYNGILILRTAAIDIVSTKNEIIMSEEQYEALADDPQISLIYDSGTVKALQR